MTEDDLLSVLDSEAEAAFDYMGGVAAQARAQAMRDYLRLPYDGDDENDGRSNVVSSDVFDGIEGMLPELLEVFVGTDEAVRFDPVGPEDVEGAQQATDACNYVFYKKNNGFFVLYTLAKDALQFRTGAVKWCYERKRTPVFTTYANVPEMQLAVYLTANPAAEVMEQSEGDQPGTFTVKIKTVKESGRVRVDNVPPDEFRVSPSHNSVLLDECPYVAHVTRKSLSDIRQMGFPHVTREDVMAAQREETTADADLRAVLDDDDEDLDSEDEAQLRGWLREEYVLVDFDGDGIAERRRIIRLGQKILENKETSHVQMAGWTPYILTHRFRGISVADLLHDFQRISTEITRQNLDNLQLANNNETVVQTDASGAPLANIDDLLNRRPGGIIRERVAGAVRPYQEHWKGLETAPMIELMNAAKENRTGWTRYSQGLDANSLNKTATGVSMIMNASQKRMKLMARIMAEGAVAPMFRGIFKTLTDHQMEPIAFRLRNKFVQFDPQEWRDGYDMSINVGIGAGDKFQQMQMLGGIEAAQVAAVQGGGLGTMVTMKNLYNLQKRKVELAGFKDANEFWTEPPEQMPQQQPAPPDPRVIAEQTRAQGEAAKLEHDGQKFMAERQADAMRFRAEKQFEATERDKDRALQWAMKMADVHKDAAGQDAMRSGAEAQQVIDEMSRAMQIMAQEMTALKQPRVKTGRAVKQADGSWVLQTADAPDVVAPKANGQAPA